MNSGRMIVPAAFIRVEKRNNKAQSGKKKTRNEEYGSPKDLASRTFDFKSEDLFPESRAKRHLLSGDQSPITEKQENSQCEDNAWSDEPKLLGIRVDERSRKQYPNTHASNATNNDGLGMI